MNLFVYCNLQKSLRQDSCPDVFSEDFVRDSLWGRLYTYDLRAPFMILNGEHAGNVQGEIFEVDHEKIHLLDEYMGVHMGFFKRATSVTKSGVRVQVYVAGETTLGIDREDWCRVISGSWLQYSNDMSGLVRIVDPSENCPL